MAGEDSHSHSFFLRSTDGVDFDMSKMIGRDEDFKGITNHTDVYPTIDPAPLYAAHAFKDRVVLLTGASRGIGAEIALQFGRAGATLVLVARNQELLDALKSSIQKENAGARLTTYVADVMDTAAAERIVKQTVATYGHLDVVVANAGVARPSGERMGVVDPLKWWNIVEVNLRGVYNFVHFALPHLEKSKGVVAAVTSVSSLYRQFTYSDYSISKQAVNRLIDFIPIEYSGVKSFAVHPGNVATDMMRASGIDEATLKAFATESPSLAAATILYLSAGKADWLSGRFVSSKWDLGEVEKKYKAKVVEGNGLVSKLYIP